MLALTMTGSAMTATASTPPSSTPQASFEEWAARQGQSLSAVSCATEGTAVTCYGTTSEGSILGASAALTDLAWTSLPPLAGAPQVTTTTTSIATTTVAARPADDNDHLFTSGAIIVPPGTPGEVSVAVTAPPSPASDNSTVPMIVRNNTTNVVSGIEVTGGARDAAGTLTASGSSQGFLPGTLEPGDWAIGFVFFDIDALTGDETFDFSVSFDDGPAGALVGRIDLPITEATLQGDRVVGVVRNESTSPGTLAQVYVACFNAGTLNEVYLGFVDGFEVPPGGSSPFTVDLFGPCEVFAAAGGAFG
jgi:hypothetical protein